MIKKMTPRESNSPSGCLARRPQNCGTKSSHIVQAANGTDSTFWCHLLKLEVIRTVRATRELDPATYFLSDIEEQPE